MRNYRFLTLIVFAVSILAACSNTASAPTASSPTIESTPTPQTDTPLLPTSTAKTTSTSAFDVQKLEGIWVAQNQIYIRHSRDGKFTVAEDSIKTFLGRPLEGTIIVEGDLVKLYGEAGCLAKDVGIYRIEFSESGDNYTLTLVEDPCEWRKGGQVPAANTYHKLEALVLPGTYKTVVTQAEAAGGGDLLNYVGEWDLQLNADDTFVLLQNGQPVAEGAYLSVGEQFILEDVDICSGSSGPVVRALTDEGSVTFSQDPHWTRGYMCKGMLLILTGHPWAKK